MLEMNDIQSGVLRPRQMPYVATYLLLRIDDPADGHELLKQLTSAVASAAEATSPLDDTWIMVALSYQGLKALGVPQASLESFSPEFQQGMAARAAELGDVDENAPSHWERPFGTSEVHLALAATAPDRPRLEQVLERARPVHRQLPGVPVIYRQDCAQLPTGREHFGFLDSISQPAIEGSDLTGTNPREAPLKAGEFVLGYLDEAGRMPPMPQPEVLGRNGSYVAFRKLHHALGAAGMSLPCTVSVCEPRGS
jgi:deferrochelatase/peroxidase EfeB